MKTIHLKEVSAAFSSRALGRRYRRQVEDSKVPVRFDFDGVWVVSGSFADEVFGVLVRDHGLDWLSEHVAFANVDPEVRDTILQVIDRRLPADAVI